MKTPDFIKGICIVLFGFGLISCGDKDVALKDIKVNPESVSMYLGFRTQITATPVPLDATEQTFEWSSANTDIVNVTRFGIVEAVGEGTTSVTVKKGGLEKTIQVTVTDPIVIPDRKSSWLFDDPANILKADVGQALTSVVEGGAIVSVDGPAAGNKAVRIPKESYLVARHGIAPNGGGTRVNEFTIMFDFKIPATETWYALLQTDPDNANDAEIFIKASNQVGVGTTGYGGNVKANVWNRLVVSAKLGKSYTYYLNGEKTHDSEELLGVDHERYSWGDVILFCADNDGEDAEIDISEVAVWDVPLDELQVKKLERLRK